MLTMRTIYLENRYNYSCQHSAWPLTDFNYSISWQLIYKSPLLISFLSTITLKVFMTNSKFFSLILDEVSDVQVQVILITWFQSPTIPNSICSENMKYLNPFPVTLNVTFKKASRNEATPQHQYSMESAKLSVRSQWISQLTKQS